MKNGLYWMDPLYKSILSMSLPIDQQNALAKIIQVISARCQDTTNQAAKLFIEYQTKFPDCTELLVEEMTDAYIIWRVRADGVLGWPVEDVLDIDDPSWVSVTAQKLFEIPDHNCHMFCIPSNLNNKDFHPDELIDFVFNSQMIKVLNDSDTQKIVGINWMMSSSTIHVFQLLYVGPIEEPCPTILNKIIDLFKKVLAIRDSEYRELTVCETETVLLLK